MTPDDLFRNWKQQMITIARLTKQNKLTWNASLRDHVTVSPVHLPYIVNPQKLLQDKLDRYTCPRDLQTLAKPLYTPWTYLAMLHIYKWRRKCPPLHPTVTGFVATHYHSYLTLRISDKFKIMSPNSTGIKLHNKVVSIKRTQTNHREFRRWI